MAEAKAEAKAEAEDTAKTEDTAKLKRVVIRFVDKENRGVSFPTEDCKGLMIVHNPEDGKLESKKYALKWDELQKQPDLIRQLALFGASVHLRNQINTEKDEEEARAKFESRFEGFKTGVYRMVGEGGTRDVMPKVIMAYRNALITADIDEAKVKEKVDAYLNAWNTGDKAKKAELRKRLMGSDEVQLEYAKLIAPKDKAETTKLGDL